MLTIINYGCGNIGSISNMLKKISVNHNIATLPDEVLKATSLILPGVGHFKEGMRVLSEDGWLPILNQKVIIDKIPVLGICLGMQLMTSYSEEGNCKGLNWVSANVKRFKFDDSNLKVPHMGWNEVQTKFDSPLFKDFDKLEDIRYYHVHAYFVELDDPKFEIARTFYGVPFTSGFQNENIYGVQFHPEKSHKYGLNLLSNFSKL